jgi:hypothetical protein
MPIPGARISWIRDSDVHVLAAEVARAAGALFFAVLTVPKLISDGRFRTAAAAGAVAAGMCLASVLSAISAWRQKRTRASPHDLEGCLHILHAVLCAAAEDPPEARDPGLRVTLHVARRGPNGPYLEQVCDYICADGARSGGKRRRFSVHCGLVGKVFRENKVGHVERLSDNHADFIDEMVTRWNYTKPEAMELDAGVMSYMAVPLPSKDRGVEAVIFMDSTRRKFFTKTRQDLIEGAGIGIALFVGRRYN